jgi:hypothetical protein
MTEEIGRAEINFTYDPCYRYISVDSGSYRLLRVSRLIVLDDGHDLMVVKSTIVHCLQYDLKYETLEVDFIYYLCQSQLGTHQRSKMRPEIRVYHSSMLARSERL